MDCDIVLFKIKTKIDHCLLFEGSSGQHSLTVLDFSYSVLIHGVCDMSKQKAIAVRQSSF